MVLRTQILILKAFFTFFYVEVNFNKKVEKSFLIKIYFFIYRNAKIKYFKVLGVLSLNKRHISWRV